MIPESDPFAIIDATRAAVGFVRSRFGPIPAVDPASASVWQVPQLSAKSVFAATGFAGAVDVGVVSVGVASGRDDTTGGGWFAERTPKKMPTPIAAASASSGTPKLRRNFASRLGSLGGGAEARTGFDGGPPLGRPLDRFAIDTPYRPSRRRIPAGR